MNYIEISINKAFLIKTALILAVIGGGYTYGELKYRKGVEDTVQYVIQMQNQPSKADTHF
jgi:hypothetical protein